MSRIGILEEIEAERGRQIRKWGIQHRPSFPVDHRQCHAASIRDALREACDASERRGPSPNFTGGASWFEIAQEESWEAYAETKDRAARRIELIQAAAVLVAWIEDLDSEAK